MVRNPQKELQMGVQVGCLFRFGECKSVFLGSDMSVNMVATRNKQRASCMYT